MDTHPARKRISLHELGASRPRIREPVVVSDNDDEPVVSAPSLLNRKPRALDPEDLKKFVELNTFCSPYMRNFMEETYGKPTEGETTSDDKARVSASADREGQNESDEVYEGGSEGSTPA